MREQKLAELLQSFAARTPTPGGGSASAIGGALGSALAAMAAAFTTQNEKYAAVEARVTALMAELDALRAQMLDLADADVAAYGAYAAARKLPKGTPEEKAARAAALSVAGRDSIAVPERIVAAAREGLRVTEELGAIANPNLAGDVAVAAYFLEAAARGAGIQVLGNCAGDDGDGSNAGRRRAVREMLGACEAARVRIDALVMKTLKIGND
jgi:methenyltetrahydrofolate cyclohydrolase